MITWKLLFDGEEMNFLTVKDLNLLKGIFLMQEMSKFLAVGWDFFPSSGFPIKVQDLNLLRGIFLMQEMSKFLAVRWDFSPSLDFP